MALPFQPSATLAEASACRALSFQPPLPFRFLQLPPPLLLLPALGTGLLLKGGGMGGPWGGGSKPQWCCVFRCAEGGKEIFGPKSKWRQRRQRKFLIGQKPGENFGPITWGWAAPLCEIPSCCCSFMGPWTVTRSSLRMLRRVAALCRPLRPMLLLVSFPRSRSPVVGVLELC